MMSFLRLREGSTESEFSEAKLSKREDEESKEMKNSSLASSLQKPSAAKPDSQTAQNQHDDTTPRHGFSGSLGSGSGLAAGSRSGSRQQNLSLNLDSSSSKKRKEPEQDSVAVADLDVSLEELESIMSEDMDEPVQPTASKKQCVGQGERSRPIAGVDCDVTFSKQRRSEKEQNISRNSEQDRRSSPHLDRKSRVTSNKTQDSEREEHSLTHRSDKCETLDVKEEEISFLLVRDDFIEMLNCHDCFR